MYEKAAPASGRMTGKNLWDQKIKGWKRRRPLSQRMTRIMVVLWESPEWLYAFVLLVCLLVCPRDKDAENGQFSFMTLSNACGLWYSSLA